MFFMVDGNKRPPAFRVPAHAAICFVSSVCLSLPLYWGGYLAARWVASLL